MKRKFPPALLGCRVRIEPIGAPFLPWNKMCEGKVGTIKRAYYVLADTRLTPIRPQYGVLPDGAKNVHFFQEQDLAVLSLPKRPGKVVWSGPVRKSCGCGCGCDKVLGYLYAVRKPKPVVERHNGRSLPSGIQMGD